MSIGRPFQFLHAGDFRLHRPITGLGEIPDAWRQFLAEAPRRAATRVFDAALSRQVDFVVLSGGLLDWRQAAVSDYLFLRGQLERLAERNVAVYWAGGPDDSPEDRPSEFPLPSGTVVFPCGAAQEHTFHLDVRRAPAWSD